MHLTKRSTTHNCKQSTLTFSSEFQKSTSMDTLPRCESTFHHSMVDRHSFLSGLPFFDSNRRLPIVVCRLKKTNFRFPFLFAANKKKFAISEENKVPFSISICSKQKKFAISVFRWQQTNGSCRFPFAVGGDMKINMNMKIGMDMNEVIKKDMDDDVETWTWTWTWNHGQEPAMGKG
jgi:hypothetical protein